mmetsp:Transcript_22787/g.29517  ORF Transcript_22787/g.29517 Transcript_22787/m.29517 type:complete len:294 (-) Transcript_22787:661-1542(-)
MDDRARPWDINAEIDNEPFARTEIQTMASTFSDQVAPTGPNTPENDPDREEAQIKIRNFFESVQGKSFIIRHLLSGAGMQLNGLQGTVVGHDTINLNASKFDVTEQLLRARFHLRLEKTPTRIVRIRASNLNFPGNVLDIPSQTRLDDEDLLSLLQTILEQSSELLQSEREDVKRRIRFTKRCLEASEIPPPLPCGTLMIPDHELVNHSLLLQTTRICRFACCGDSVADLRRFGEGLLAPDALHSGAYQVRDVQAQIYNRLSKWLLIGYCERCQIAHMENDPLTSVDPDKVPH